MTDADASTVAGLQARVAELQREVEDLRAGVSRPGRRRWRTPVAVVLVLIGLLLAPVAAVGTWTRAQLVDTDHFVATFAPLAQDEDVQRYVASEIANQINRSVDIPGQVAVLFDGIESMNLPPLAGSTLALLEAPTTAGLESLVDDAAMSFVTSDRFATVWDEALRQSHRQTVAALQGDPAALLRIESDGALSIQLAPLVDAVKLELADRGMFFARLIPGTDRAIMLAPAGTFGDVRFFYNVATIGGYWLPWLVFGLLIAGVLVARSPRRAFTVTAVAVALVFIAMVIGLGITQNVFVRAVSPDPMPGAVARAMFETTTVMMVSTVSALAVLGVMVAVAAWFGGPSRVATAVRGVCTAVFAAIRDRLDAFGGHTGRLGAGVDRWRTTIVSAVALLGFAALVFYRPVTTAGVVWMVIAVLAAVVLVELVRRPPVADEREPDERESGGREFDVRESGGRESDVREADEEQADERPVAARTVAAQNVAAQTVTAQQPDRNVAAQTVTAQQPDRTGE